MSHQLSVSAALKVETDVQADPARAARGLVRRGLRGHMQVPASGMQGGVLSASDLDGSPLVLVPQWLAVGGAEVHVRYAAEFDAKGLPAGSVTVHGELMPMIEEPALGRYIARFANRQRLDPANMQDGGLALYHLSVSSVSLQTPEGAVKVLQALEYLLDCGDAPDHTQREWDNLVHQNYQHLDINEQLATQILEQPPGRWLLTGLDPEGMDFRLGPVTCRLPFPTLALTQKELNVAIKFYLHEARARLASPTGVDR
jgi:hypothetical protein